jgi:hypothetical protein
MNDRFNQLNNFPGIASSFVINKSQGSGTLIEIVIPFEAEA